MLAFIGVWLVVALSMTASAQTVSLRNVSYPGTAIEVGNVVEVAIAGADPFGTVTVVQNGAPPYEFGTTDANGEWSVTATETADYVGIYNQRWYVNGVELTQNNPSATYLPYAPRLPDFSVHSNFTGSNDAPQSTVSAGCGASNNARQWRWSPVTYNSTSSISSSIINGATSSWNSAQSKLSFSSNTSVRLDLLLYDGSTSGGAFGETFVYGQDCSPCHNLTNVCNGACMSAAAVYYADIALNIGEINAAAAVFGVPASSVSPIVVRHELGHGLRLGHPSLFDGKCSEVKSLMYPSGSVLFGCGITAPTSRDTASINGVYPSAVAVCPATQSNYCIVPSATCA